MVTDVDGFAGVVKFGQVYLNCAHVVGVSVVDSGEGLVVRCQTVGGEIESDVLSKEDAFALRGRILEGIGEVNV